MRMTVRPLCAAPSAVLITCDRCGGCMYQRRWDPRGVELRMILVVLNIEPHRLGRNPIFKVLNSCSSAWDVLLASPIANMKVLIFALLVVAVRSQPQPCEAPNVWEGRVFEVIPSRRFERIGKISYDKLGERFRIIEELNGGNVTVRYDDLFLHKEKVFYRYNLMTRQCTKEALTDPFQPIEVVPGARFETEVYIGTSSLPGGSVAVDLYGGERTVEGPYQATFTTEQCIPVTSAHISTTVGFVHWNFYDVTLGISDPNVFIPHEACRDL